MEKNIEQIQKENRKFILEAIHGCSYEEALQKQINYNYNHYIDALRFALNIERDKKEIIEIIEKPITLSMVLLAFKNKDIKNLYGHRIIFNIAGSQFCGLQLNPCYSLYGAGDWNLELETLEEQSEGTQRGINELFNN